ncbi:hypothetical protein LAWASA_3704 [Lawsonibacter asaccharolyticus]|nr:hypothetical protein LAWASA_3704 [Lawsonibacter asaccharolyticus]
MCDSVTTGGLTYDYWSCLYPDSSRTFRASAWTANADVEKMSANTVGAQGVLYSETQKQAARHLHNLLQRVWRYLCLLYNKLEDDL